jgi:IgGFc binding protein
VRRYENGAGERSIPARMTTQPLMSGNRLAFVIGVALGAVGLVLAFIGCGPPSRPGGGGGDDDGGACAEAAAPAIRRWLAVPVEQYRTDYVFHAPASYQSNYVDVTAPIGAIVKLDGVRLTLTPIGASGFGLARAEELSTGPLDDGNHTITCDKKVGISVYGYGQYTSYWYPGGLDLAPIIN